MRLKVATIAKLKTPMASTTSTSEKACLLAIGRLRPASWECGGKSAIGWNFDFAESLSLRRYSYHRIFDIAQCILQKASQFQRMIIKVYETTRSFIGKRTRRLDLLAVSAGLVVAIDQNDDPPEQVAWRRQVRFWTLFLVKASETWGH
jgi:hypothetical protein